MGRNAPKRRLETFRQYRKDPKAGFQTFQTGRKAPKRNLEVSYLRMGDDLPGFKNFKPFTLAGDESF